MFEKFAIIAAIAALGGAYVYIKIIGSESELAKLYPNVPKKELVKKHRQFISDVISGKTTLPENADDVAIARIFEQNYLKK